MNRFIKRSLMMAALCVAMLAGGGSAHAWYKVRNGTANPIWVSHAFASTSGWFCGWNDSCDDNGTKGWRIDGWWNIAPGGTSQIHSKGFGNAVHQLYVIDDIGHVWGGNGGWWGTPNNAFSRCEGLFTELDMPYYRYLKITTSWCCGGNCNANHTSNITL